MKNKLCLALILALLSSSFPVQKLSSASEDDVAVAEIVIVKVSTDIKDLCKDQSITVSVIVENKGDNTQRVQIMVIATPVNDIPDKEWWSPLYSFDIGAKETATVDVPVEWKELEFPIEPERYEWKISAQIWFGPNESEKKDGTITWYSGESPLKSNAPSANSKDRSEK